MLLQQPYDHKVKLNSMSLIDGILHQFYFRDNLTGKCSGFGQTFFVSSDPENCNR